MPARTTALENELDRVSIRILRYESKIETLGETMDACRLQWRGFPNSSFGRKMNEEYTEYESKLSYYRCLAGKIRSQLNQ